MVTLLTSDDDRAPTMTTTAAEYTSLPHRFSVLSLGPSPSPGAAGSSFPYPAELAGCTDGGGRADAAPTPRKAWKSPPRRPPDAVMDEPVSSWPLLSRDAPPSGKKKWHHQVTSSPASLTGGDPAMGSDLATVPVIPADQEDHEQPQVAEQKPEPGVAAAPAPPVDTNPKTVLPPPLLLDPPRQPRPPVQNHRKGRYRPHHPKYQNNRNGNNGHGNHNGYGGGQHHPRPRYHQEVETVGNSYYGLYQQHGRPMDFYSFPQDLAYNPMQGQHWGPNPPVDPLYIGMFPPPQENLYHNGYHPGPYFHNVFPFPPPPPIMSPPIIPNPQIRTTPLSMAGPLLQSQLPNVPLPPAPLSPAAAVLQPQFPLGNVQHEGEGLNARLRRQIEYYFSDENLLKDGYLKRCMDNQGWVSVHTIADFPRVRNLTGDCGVILEALKSSTTVEVSVDKMRRKGEWIKWIIQQ